MKFNIAATWGKARSGQLITPHGQIDTPIFMPVGTKASVKALSPEDLIQAGAQIILGNTYHLYLRPGDQLIADLGGLHQFAAWPRPLLTDSGGFQVSSLGHFRTDQELPRQLPSSIIDENGVVFYSHIDGSKHYIDAEKSIQIQENLGADIIMAFDEATPDKGREYAQKAMERTHRWLDRSIEEWLRLEAAKKGSDKTPQHLFGIIQGGNYPQLRKISAKYVINKDLPGIAIGGGSIGANREVTSTNVEWIRPLLPKAKPLYLMGVGVCPEDIISAILDGADMFDCVGPTRLARTGILYSGQLVTLNQANKNLVYRAEFNSKPILIYESDLPRARLHIGNSVYQADQSPIMADCGCYTCQTGFSRAYLRHLFKSRELLYYRLASIHNIYHMLKIAKQMKQLIEQYSD